MSYKSSWREKLAQSRSVPRAYERALERRIASAAGTDYFNDRDPVYQVTESFQTMFDMMGAQRAQGRTELFAAGMESMIPGLWSGGRETERESETEGGRTADFLNQTSMDAKFEAPADENGRFLNRFSEIAFSRGALSGAILRNRGQMMLFSCLKRTIGQSQPSNLRQRTLFSGASAERYVSGRQGDRVYFNRGQVDGAVALVADVTRDARRVVDTLSALASGESALPEGSGAETLRRMYPFLSVERERALRAEYRERLQSEADPRKKAILKSALAKTEALIDKKQQMKFRFMHELRHISDSATAALTVFDQPAFAQEILARLKEYGIPGPPPEDEGDEGGPEDIHTAQTQEESEFFKEE